MALRYLMDVHVARAITAALRAQGLDVLTAQEDGADRLFDPLLLDRATALGRVLFSQDQDLIVEAVSRQRDGRFFAGVIYSEQSLSVGICVRDLGLMGYLMDPEEMHNQLKYLPL